MVKYRTELIWEFEMHIMKTFKRKKENFTFNLIFDRELSLQLVLVHPPVLHVEVVFDGATDDINQTEMIVVSDGKIWLVSKLR
jgi:hypothetical protein